MEYDANELCRLLELEELDKDLYRARNPTQDEGYRLFGGQVAAQALLAAALTVPAGRLPHSMHGYFLRPGQWERPILLHVDRDRDGGSYSARHVVARQNGEAIFTLSASFHGSSSDRPGMPARGAAPLGPPPDAGDDELVLSRPLVKATFELRLADGVERVPQLPARFWARSRARLPDDPLVHRCALAYLSDVGSGYGPSLAGANRGAARGGPSLDHAVWFHRDARLDDWVLVDLRPEVADGARAVYTGTVRDRAGDAVATIAQQHILESPQAG